MKGDATPAEYQAALRSVTFSATETTASSWNIGFIAYNSLEGGNRFTAQVNIIATAPAANPPGLSPAHGQHQAGTIDIQIGQHGRHQSAAVAVTAWPTWHLPCRRRGRSGGRFANDCGQRRTDEHDFARPNFVWHNFGWYGQQGRQRIGEHRIVDNVAANKTTTGAGRHQFAATDAALSDFDSTDLYV